MAKQIAYGGEARKSLMKVNIVLALRKPEC